jgi:hypothetical protein
MRATKPEPELNAQVQPTNLQTMYERGTRTATSESVQRRHWQLDLEYQDWASPSLQGRGPHTAGGHGRKRHRDVGGPGLAGAVLVGDGTARTSVELELDACSLGT